MSWEVGNNCAGLPPAVVVWESCECFVMMVACVRPWAGCSVPERSSAFVATVLTEWPASVSWCKSTKGVVYKDQNIPLKEWVSEIVITTLSLTLCPHNWLKEDVYTAMKWALQWLFSMTQATHIIKSVYVWASLSLLTGDLSLRLAPNVSVSKGRVAVIDYWVIAADRVRVCDGLVMCEELNANVSRTGLFSPRPSLPYPFKHESVCLLNYTSRCPPAERGVSPARTSFGTFLRGSLHPSPYSLCSHSPPCLPLSLFAVILLFDFHPVPSAMYLWQCTCRHLLTHSQGII